jgi:fumarate reductase (CoM/CoB) subunit A
MSKYIEISICKEIIAGRANEHNACYLETSALKRLTPILQQWYGYFGVDFNKEYVEISAAHQCSNGGLRVDLNGQTSLPGLYAIGETAAGPHGADRLGGAMMAFCQVFGRRAGKHAAGNSKKRILAPLNKSIIEEKLRNISELKERQGDYKPLDLTNKLKQIAWENLLLIRSEKGLTRLLREMEYIHSELIPHLSVASTTELVQALELKNLLKVGKIIARAALLRTESRGGHYREDFPDRDDKNWLQIITVQKANGEMQFNTVKIDDQWEDRPEYFGDGWWG